MWIGIDFGTSNSSAAWLVSGHPHPIRERLRGNAFFPSCVLLTPPENGKDAAQRLLTGIAAEGKMTIYPDRFRAELKRELGTPWPLLLGGESLPVVEAIAAVMRSVRIEAERSEPEPSAMLTVPVAFGSDRVAMIEQAARSAGFSNLATCLEPEAAARYHVYAARDTDPDDRDETILIYDFGGGTFDTSLVRKTGDTYAVIASAGLEDCGGVDIDRDLFGAIVERASPAVGASLSGEIDPSAGDDATFRALKTRLLALDRCRRIKHDLSLYDSSEAEFGEPAELIRIGRNEFYELVTPYVERTISCCESIVREAKLEWKDISRIMLVGGTTHIPLITTALETATGRPVRSVLDPELAVSFGAALSTARPEKKKRTALFGDVDPATFSLQAHIDAAPDGGTLRLPPGIYREGLRVTGKTIELICERGPNGERASVVADGKSALHCENSTVRARDIEFAASNTTNTIYLSGGSFEADACVIRSSTKGAAVSAVAAVTTAGARLVLRECRITGSEADGVRVNGPFDGEIAGCDISGNENGIALVTVIGQTFAIHDNGISKNKKAGISITDSNDGTVVENNDIFENADGIKVLTTGCPAVRGNRIYNNSNSGILLAGEIAPLIEGNALNGNAIYGISFSGRTQAIVRGNTIEGPACGMWLIDSEAALIENRIAGKDGVVVTGAKSSVWIRANALRVAETAIDLRAGNATVELNTIEPVAEATVGIAAAASVTTQIRYNRFARKMTAFRLPRNGKWTVRENRPVLRPLSTPALEGLAQLLEVSRWEMADRQTVDLLCAAAGAKTLGIPECAKLAPQVLAEIVALWRAAGPPLAGRPWISSGKFGGADVSPLTWRFKTPIQLRLEELKLAGD